jgi:hypothetical protein
MLARLELPCHYHFPGLRVGDVVPVLEELVDLGLCLCPGVAVAGLDLADELIAAALDLVQIVIGELAPLLLDLAAQLSPSATEDIFVHSLIFLSVRFGEAPP